jgi:hypothetical protein
LGFGSGLPPDETIGDRAEVFRAEFCKEVQRKNQYIEMKSVSEFINQLKLILVCLAWNR